MLLVLVPPLYAASGPGQWVATTLEDTRSDVAGIHFYDAQQGVCCGGAGVWRTRDGGLSWESLPIPKTRNRKTGKEGHGWYSVRMVTPEDIWAYGQLHPGGMDQTQLLRSADGGQTWEEVLAGKLDHVGPLVFDGPKWWVLAENGSLAYVSQDRGETWKTVNLGRRGPQSIRPVFPDGQGRICRWL